MQTMILVSSQELSEIISKAVEAVIKKSPYYSLSTNADELLSREEAANYLNVSTTTITKYVKEGRLRHGGTNRKYLFRKSDLDKFVFKSAEE